MTDAVLALVHLVAIQQPGPSLLPTPTPTTAFGANVINFSFLLSALIWAPVIVAATLAVIPNPRGRFNHVMLQAAFWTNAGMLLLTLIGYTQFLVLVTGLQGTGLQFEENHPWIPALGIGYHLGVDGIGITMLLLSGLCGVIAVLASAGVKERVREYFVLLLLAQATVTGVICARDFFVLVMFWASAALPLALLVMGWGGPRRLSAASHLFGYWGLGSAALLAAGLMLNQATGWRGFDFDMLLKATPSPRAQLGIGLAILVAAGTRLPLVPLHGWVRDVLSEAPTGVAILVVGVAARLGGYLLVLVLAGAEHDGARTLAPFVAAFGAVTAGYGALAAMRAEDIRRAAAYLALLPGAVTVLGVAGLTPLSLNGAVLSLFAGGLAAAAVVGACATVAERAQTRSLQLLAGLAPRMPRLAWLTVLAAMGLLGVPFLAGYPAQVMVFFGSFRTQPAGTFGVGLGLALAAIALGLLLYRVLFGAPNPEAPPARDSSLSESWYLGLLVGALIWVGVVPGGPKLAGVPFFDPGLVNVVNSSVSDLAAPFVPPAPINSR